MPIGSCRGSNNKSRIVSQYNLSPIAHVKLLGDQSRNGCCGEITDRYYHFEATPKIGGKAEAFIVGYDCAEQLLTLTGHAKLPLFNPLATAGAPGGAGGVANGQNPAVTMCPVNRELYNAIHLLCIAWDSTPGQPLRSLLRRVTTNPGVPVGKFEVTGFNTIVGADHAQRTLTQIVQSLGNNNQALRPFAFTEMEAVLQANNKVSNL